MRNAMGISPAWLYKGTEMSKLTANVETLVK